MNNLAKFIRANFPLGMILNQLAAKATEQTTNAIPSVLQANLKSKISNPQ